MTEFTPDTIAYGRLMHQAMRGLIRQVLSNVADHGLPGEHHFFVTFDTSHDGVDIADWLVDRYPDEMTIVIQHWFDNLVVTESGFQITLNFGDNPEPLSIPFSAILTFVDPSVEFGLRFETREEDGDDDPGAGLDMPAAEPLDDSPKPGADAEVVSLDSFRKGN